MHCVCAIKQRRAHAQDGHPVPKGTDWLVVDALRLCAPKHPVHLLLAEYRNTQMQPRLMAQASTAQVGHMLSALMQHTGEVARNPYHLTLPAWLMDGVRPHRTKAKQLLIRRVLPHNTYMPRRVNHYENFPVASWLCPARLRPVIAAIYWFARTADDLADEGDAPLAKRLGELETYRANLHAVAKGHDPCGHWAGLFEALAPHIVQHKLPVDLLDKLLDAFEQDISYTAAAHWYADHAELLAYCQLSANPVGRLLLHLYGVTNAVALIESDNICSALQLINFWQDLSVDLPNRRYYAPLDLMTQYGVNPMVLMAGQDTEHTMNLVAACADLAWARMQKGSKLPARVQNQLGGFDGWRASLELRCVIQGGLRILDKIRFLKHRTVSQRPTLGKWDVCVVLWRALWM